uniref:Mediator complex subunit 15 KIX domain-containing protein n=1 Tax=Triticum urartu TaxID=4572 RepID=A0A8R7PLD8_TRIUA
MDANWGVGVGVDLNAPPPTGGDWRAQLLPEARSRVVNKIMECLKKHLPVSVPEGLNELQIIAVRFEDKIYAAATSQSDYLRKISLKMLSMETKTQPGNAQVIPNQMNLGQGIIYSKLSVAHFIIFAWILFFVASSAEIVCFNALNQPPPSPASCLRMPDGTPWRPTQGPDPAAVAAAVAAAGVHPNASAPTGGDWRPQLQPEARSRIVNKIMESLKKHLPVSRPEGLNELEKIAVRFEEKIYNAATSQSDYLRKVSLKMLSMETKT